MRKHCYYLLLLPLFFLTMCSPKPIGQSHVFEDLYNSERKEMQIQTKVHHFSNDSSTLWIKIPNEQIVYTRKTSSENFNALLKLHLSVFTHTEKDIYSFLDSASLENKISYNEEGYLVSSFNFHLASGSEYRIDCTINDLKQESEEELEIYSDKRSKHGPDDFLIYTSENYPVFGCAVNEKDSLRIFSPRNKDKTLYQFHYSNKASLPRPPYMDGAKDFDFEAFDDMDQIQGDGQGWYYSKNLSSLQIISFKENAKSGHFILKTAEHFPELREVENLGNSLRYISSRTEYRQIKNSKYPKLKIDEFWMDCGGTADQARELIKIYYGRVADANQYFTTYTEGWRSDRGLIMVVFGHPPIIEKRKDRETWYYGNPNDSESLSFTFFRELNSLSNNHFVMERKQQYMDVWQKTVSNWRNGKIYNY